MTQELHGVISLGGTVIGGSLNQRGLKGETGEKGDTGNAATVTVGSTTTGDAGTSASVTNSGDIHNAVLDFTIPKGDKGDTGATGDVNTYIAEYGTASYADIGDAITEGKYVIAVKDDNYYPLVMFSNSSYVFSYIHENICHEVVCDSYSTWTARTHTSVRDVKQNGASVTTSGVALVTTPQPTTTTPKMDGTAAVGSETTWAKGDHVHPSDTSKSDVGHTHTKSDITDFSHTHTKSEITDFPTLATVATSGDYDDLTDKPAIHNVPSGGSTGQVLAKNSNTDYDLTWTTAGGGGTVTDVTVDGTSVLDGTVGKVVLTGKADAVHTHVKTDITDFPSLATVATSGSYSDLTNKPSIPTVTDTYSGTSSDGMSGKAVKSAIDALDGTVSGSAGASNTLTAFSQTDGKVSATFGSISITKSQVSDFPTIPSSAGDVGAIALPSSPSNGDFLVYNGSSWVAQSLSTWQGGSY